MLNINVFYETFPELLGTKILVLRDVYLISGGLQMYLDENIWIEYVHQKILGAFNKMLCL